ncbi:MAG TPA: DUF1629 domain-containing protein [Xanthobacteraceae bacterium]|jgi:hypothetical protein|nr:DUF1629 domain-containing protein [Xanthobacteraceae bacterium]
MRRPGKKRKFYVMTQKYGTRGTGYRLVNKDELLGNSRQILAPPIERRGFQDYLATPIFLSNSKLGHTDRDFQIYSGYWFVSDRMRGVLETVDPQAFAFLACKVQMPDGSGGPLYWLCDVVRVLDALDEEQSEIRIRTASDGSKVYDLLGNPRLIFKESVLGQCHVFRMKFFDAKVICDNEMKLACKAAGLTGLAFPDAS